jgi:acyl-CoA reductase-like NAD-dependent aldehyde dehydrogenase
VNTISKSTYGTVSLPTSGLAGNFINGEWCKPIGGKTLDVINPCRLDTIAAIGAADSRDIDVAVAAAKAAFP